MSLPPTATLATGPTWKIQLVIYPSGAYLEFVETSEGIKGCLRYSERIDHFPRIADKLRADHWAKKKIQ